jgi:hypothetical protein
MSPRLLRPRASGGFTPQAISGLGVWYDASVASSITLNGSTVSQWNDLSGNNRHLTQSTALQQPGYNATGQNGKGVLTFDGTNQRIFTTAGGASGVDNVSLFAVIYHAAGGANEDTAFGIGVSGAIRRVRSMYRSVNATTMGISTWANDIATSAYSVDIGGGYHVFSILQTNRTVQIGRDGTRTTYTVGSDTLTVNSNNVFVGGVDTTSDGGNRRIEGSIAECIAYYVDIGATAAQRVERYLGAKWGITVA